MKSAAVAAEQPGVSFRPPTLAVGVSDRRTLVVQRLRDYLELTKPRIAALSLFTVAIGYMLAGPSIDLSVMLQVLAGTALVAAGASTFNQWLEREYDARMARTLARPLPAGRLSSWEAISFALVLSAGGLVYLAAVIPNRLCALTAAATWAGYVFVYTPLKRLTPWNTAIGAVPGALPPLIGWFAVRSDVGIEVLSVFSILYLWQLPHFFAIAWMYRDDYARAGMKMLPVVDRTGKRTRVQVWVATLALFLAGLSPIYTMSSGWLYGTSAVALGGMFLLAAWRFYRQGSGGEARRVLRASFLYLPLVLLALIVDRVLLG